ncbi:MAG: hypothetical protein MJ016_00060 [Victivallaceae bacterium]|nr:hypothetical protein [Victivallaceae bacterium]
MNPSPGFFATLFSVCRGTAGFPVFVRNHFGKVFWHLLLLSLLIAFAVATWHGVKLYRDFSGLRRAFIGAFGERVVFDGRGVFPGRDEEKARSIVLPRKGRLCYAGNHPDAVRAIGDLGGVDYLVLWRGGSFAVGYRRDDRSWAIIRAGETENVFSAPDAESALQFLILEPEPRDVSGAVGERVEMTVPSLEKILLSAYWTALFVFEGLVALTVALFSTGFFSLFVATGNRGGDSPSFFKRYLTFWKSGIYAGFPGMLIGGCFPLLELPFFNYAQVYFFALLVYWMTVLARYKHQWSGNDSAPQGGFYDD